MQVTEIDIENFRSIPETSIGLGDFNLLIGKNNAGKSNIVKAIYRYRDLVAGNVDISDFYESAVTRGKQPEPIKFSISYQIEEGTRENLIESLSENHEVSASVYDTLMDSESFQKYNHEISIRETGVSHNTINTCLNGSKVELGTLDVSDESVELLDLDELMDKNRSRHQLSDKPSNQINDVIPSSIQGGILGEFSEWKIIAPFRRTEERGVFGADPDLDPTGENLTTFLQSIREDGTGRYSKICKQYEDIMEGVDEVRIETREDGDGNAVPTIRIDEQQSDDIGLDELSSGAKEILILVTQIIVSRSDNSPLYIEEPELHLHPAAEREIYSMITRVAQDYNTQVIVTTHSDVFVDEVNVEDIFSVKRGDYTYIDTVNQGELGEILTDIGYPTSEFLQADRIVFVEGRSDRVVLSNWAKKLDLSFSINGVEPVKFGGDEIFEDGNPYTNEIPDLLGQMGIPYKYVFDSDGEDPDKKESEIASELGLSAAKICVIDGYCIESYLAKPPRALAETLVVEQEEIEEDLPDDPYGVNMKSKFDSLFKKHLGTGYSEEKHGAAVAKKMQPNEISEEMKAMIEDIVTMERR
ncbi:SMC domain protein [Halorhabdus utahensis DSM 12940]|uniref:SMC domain protein n=1 Tax=Halorhabdus utahensis (strain DSM 12940 / JCM 11049 / AX-2) TaxID=519442 RepID=C7NQX8_HALUD|nr:AAA family ATPase [Halorhabdus utahensis]ACV11882.1 SMC domain protein [Halorhabdus utahensis DSM 12940]